MLKRSALLALGVLLMLPAGALAKVHKFVVDDPHGRNNVQFTSNAPVELITGYTNRIKGTIQYDDAFKFDAQHPFDITFEVDLASLKTGIDLRDEHMRDNFLETDKYPKAIFKVTGLQAGAKPPFKQGQVVNLKAKGQLTVHGKTVTKTVPVKVTYFPESAVTKERFPSGNMIRVQAKFPVVLAEHHIKRPEVIFQKLADTVYVTVDAFGTDGALK